VTGRYFTKAAESGHRWCEAVARATVDVFPEGPVRAAAEVREIYFGYGEPDASETDEEGDEEDDEDKAADPMDSRVTVQDFKLDPALTDALKEACEKWKRTLSAVLVPRCGVGHQCTGTTL
jgi:hypothetical protein